MFTWIWSFTLKLRWRLCVYVCRMHRGTVACWLWTIRMYVFCTIGVRLRLKLLFVLDLEWGRNNPILMFYPNAFQLIRMTSLRSCSWNDQQAVRSHSCLLEFEQWGCNPTAGAPSDGTTMSVFAVVYFCEMYKPVPRRPSWTGRECVCIGVYLNLKLLFTFHGMWRRSCNLLLCYLITLQWW